MYKSICLIKECIHPESGLCVPGVAAAENKKVEMMGLIGAGINPMVGMTVACAVAIEEASK